MKPEIPGHSHPSYGSGAPFAEGSAPRKAEETRSRLVCRRAAITKFAAALTALWLLTGCGGGLAFTGGSIPPGGSARLFGRVSAAENPQQSLSKVTIQVVAQYSATGSKTLTATTASDGSFTLPSVPTGLNTATFTVTATPVSGSNRQSQTVVFQANNGIANDLVVSLPLNTFDVSQGASISLPDLPNIPINQAKVLRAHLLNADGKRLPAQPTLLYVGNFGSIGSDGTFTGTAYGSGTITAFWYNVQSVTAQIVVDPKAKGGGPPDPPDPLPGIGSTDPQPGGSSIGQ